MSKSISYLSNTDDDDYNDDEFSAMRQAQLASLPPGDEMSEMIAFLANN